jgi:diguanylate cyclase (GGDEF)-like protein
MSDVTERRRIQDQLEHDALHDALTGLPNRSLLLDRLQLASERAKRSQGGFAVLFLDLDDFKMINDSLGHVYGDQVLIEVSQRLKAVVRPGDTVARLGGDEFIVLLEQVSDDQQADRVIQRIRTQMAAPIQVGAQEIFVGFSIGVTLGDSPADKSKEGELTYSRVESGSEANTLLRNADTAMYYAKAQNRGGRMFFDWSMHEHAVFHLNMEMALRRALEGNELELYYQPVVSLPEGRLLGFEALARWPQPDDSGRWVSPADFIPLAERTGLIVPLGRWVIEAAVAKTGEIYHRRAEQGQGQQPIIMQFNLSGKQLRDPELIVTLDAALERYEVPGSLIKIELTESAIVENADHALEVMRSIRDTGAGLCIDDFGTGYSSLSQLRDLPFDVLKIDRSFVGRSGGDARDDAIIEAILSIAWALDKEVVAEGIEYREQVDFLSRLGCLKGQGFFFSRPLSSEGVDELFGGSEAILGQRS